MSDQISITGIHAFGFHGVYDHERENGQDFFVDVKLELSLAKASKSDALSDTVDYGKVCDIVIEAIAPRPLVVTTHCKPEPVPDILIAVWLPKTVEGV